VIKTWDTRFSSAPANTLIGHSFSVKRLKCHPHLPQVVCSASHDKSAIVWDSRPLPYLTNWVDAVTPSMVMMNDQQETTQPTHRPKYPKLNTIGQTELVTSVYAQNESSSSSSSSSVVNYGGRGEHGGQEISSVQHREAVTGIDFSLFSPERLVTCGMDGRVHVWEVPFGALIDNQSSKSFKS
jgi:WD40 repeat protein